MSTKTKTKTETTNQSTYVPKLTQVQIDAENYIKSNYSESDYTCYFDGEKYVNEYNIKPTVDGGTETPNPFYKIGILFSVGSNGVQSAEKSVVSARANLEAKSRIHTAFLNNNNIVPNSVDDRASTECLRKDIALENYQRALRRKAFWLHAWFIAWGTHWDAQEHKERVDLYIKAKSDRGVLDESQFDNVDVINSVNLNRLAK